MLMMKRNPVSCLADGQNRAAANTRIAAPDLHRVDAGLHPRVPHKEMQDACELMWVVRGVMSTSCAVTCGLYLHESTYDRM